MAGRSNGFGSLFVGKRIALLDGKIGEHRAGFYPLQPFDPNVFHHKRCRRVSYQPMRGDCRGYNRLWNKAMRFKQRASPVCIAASGQAGAIVRRQTL
jgi:hypothetical protein